MEEKEIYQLPAEGKMVEVTEEQYREFYKHKRKEKYLEEQDNKHKVYHYSDLEIEERDEHFVNFLILLTGTPDIIG